MSSSFAGRGFVVECAFPAAAGLATALVERDARVLVVATDAAAADDVAEQLGDRAFALAADLATADGVAALAASVPIVLGRLDGAALPCRDAAGPQAAVTDVDDPTWRRACMRLVEAPARAVRELAPQLEDGGAIVLVAPPADGGATDVLLPALRALVDALDASLRPAARIRLEANKASRDALVALLAR
jgi:hypothetical protein